MSLLVALIIGLAAGAVMFRVFRARARGSDKPMRAGAEVRREVVLPLDAASAAARCRSVLARFGAERTPPTDGALEIVTPFWKSVGTVVRAELRAVGAETRVEISAWPGGSLYDLGESKRIAQKVAAQLVSDT